MIHPGEGNLLECDAEALVNTVNTVGIMGKGIALQFKQAFPENFRIYKRACDRHEVRLGKMFVVPTMSLENPKFIINFPTKAHWRSKTRIADVEAGLRDLVEVIRHHRITSVAVPPLGCGNGGLNWADVRPLITSALSELDVAVYLFAPVGAPAADTMPVRTERPRMSPGRAALLGLMNRYVQPGYRLTLLEVQKLAYFLQAAGEPLNLRFVRAKFGPYAEELNHVLERLEGHYIRGYGDRSSASPIMLLDDPIAEDAKPVLESRPDTRARFDQVGAVISGFETPYGLELLATVHWIADRDPRVRDDVGRAIASVHTWSPRKKLMFEAEHIEVAWDHLRSNGWLTTEASVSG